MPVKPTLVFASGIACALTIALWLSTFLVNYSRRIHWGDNPRNAVDLCACDEGIVLACRADDPLDTDPPDRGARHIVNARGNDPHCFFVGFGIFHMPGYSILIFPFWPLIAATIIAPARAVWRQSRRNRRVAASLCLQCRYDLRMHRPGDRCPECGTFICPGFPIQLPVAA